jgi:hypothetical protein
MRTLAFTAAGNAISLELGETAGVWLTVREADGSVSEPTDITEYVPMLVATTWPIQLPTTEGVELGVVQTRGQMTLKVDGSPVDEQVWLGVLAAGMVTAVYEMARLVEARQ